MLQDSIQVQKLKRAYRASFTEKSAELSKVIDRLDANSPPSDELLQKIGEYLHKLAGSLAMYGYLEQAETAQLVMNIIASKTGSTLCIELKPSLCELRDWLYQEAN